MLNKNMVSNKELLERIDALESKQRGTAKAVKNVEDIQAGIGVNALIFQRVRAYFIAAILGIFGISYIIYASTTEKDAHNKETDYVIGGVCLLVSIMIVLLFRLYSGFVKNNKQAQVFNAFMIESQMLAGGR